MREISEQEWNMMEKTLLEIGNTLPKTIAAPLKLILAGIFTGRRIRDKIDMLLKIDSDPEAIMSDALEHPQKWAKIAEYLQLVEHGLDAFVAQLADKEAPE